MNFRSYRLLLLILLAGLTVADTIQMTFAQYTQRQSLKFGSPEEQSYRQQVFEENTGKINAHNSDPTKTYTEGVNQFTVLTEAEFAEIYLGTKVPVNLTVAPPMVMGAGAWAPTAFDWTTKPNMVTPIRNQGVCGNCWAFAIVGTLESLRYQTAKSIVDYSEQQLTSCSSSYGNAGCQGGWLTYAYDYVKAVGITSEAFYPYISGATGLTGTCKSNGGSFKIAGYTQVSSSCTALAAAVLVRPVSVAVDATNWSSYTSGIFSNCDTNVNHAVIVVGVNSTVWKIKNSWGTGWGKAGFIYLSASNGNNTCSVCTYGSYPN